MDSSILTTTLNQFIGVFTVAFGNIWANGGSALMWLLAAIELVLIGLYLALGDAQNISQVIKKIFFMMFWLWLVTNFPLLAQNFMDSMIQAGNEAVHPGVINLFHITDPSSLLNFGIVSIRPVMDAIDQLGMLDLGKIIMLGLSALIILLSFIILSMQVFITLIEFYLFVGLSAILLPFGINKHTKFIAEKSLAGVISFGVKLLVLAFLIEAINPILTGPGAPAITPINGVINWEEVFSMVAISMTIAFLAWNAPGIAAGIISGSPSLSAGTAMQNTLAGGAIAAVGAGAAASATRAAAGATTSLASTASAGFSRGKAFTSGGTLRKTAGGVIGAAESLGKSAYQGISKGTRQTWNRANQNAHNAMVGKSAGTGSASSTSKPAWASKLHHLSRHAGHEGHPAGGGMNARI